MITTSDTVTLDGSIAAYRAPDIVVHPHVDYENDIISVQVIALDGVSEVGRTAVSLTIATVDAKTSAKTGETAIFVNCVEQCVKDILATLNVSASFTIP